jgi:O-antigen/teichoic acid export membrane protein
LKSHSDSNNTSQAIWVGIGQLSSFSLSIISAAILSRYFDKAEYGTYKQILYIYNALLILFSAGLPGAYSYFLPKQSMEQGKDFVIKLIRAFVISGFIFSITLFLLAPVIADLFNNPDLKRGLRIFSIIPVLMLPTTGIEGVYATIRKTHVIAIYTTLTRVFMLVLITLPVVLINGTYITAIYGWIASSVVTCILAVWLILRPYRKLSRIHTPINYKDIFRYSIPLMVATVYGITIRFADQFFISRYYGSEVFAEFSNGFIDLPFVAMMIGATTTVLLPLFSKYSEISSGKELIINTWRNSTAKSVILVYPILAFFIFNSHNSVIALYGEQYSASAKYFVIGMLVGYFNIVVFNPVLFAFGKTRLYSRLHLVQAIFIWLAGFIVISLSGSALIYSILSRLFYIGQVCTGIYFATKALGVRPGEVIPFGQMAKAFLHSSVICWLVSLLLGLLKINVFLSLGLSALISAGFIFLTGRLVGIFYWETLKSMLINIPGITYFQFKEKGVTENTGII